jgi:hypothetical protein
VFFSCNGIDLETPKIMKRLMTHFNVAMAGGLFLFTMAFGQEQPKPQEYSAVWAVLGGGNAGPFSIGIRIDRYNQDEDIKRFMDILSESGPDGLRTALQDEHVGRLSIGGGGGTPIAIARKLVEGNQTIIRIVTAQNISFVGLPHSGGPGYPFTLLELRLGRSGRGAGTAIAAAGLQFDKEKNTFVIKSMQRGKPYGKLINVRMR